MPGVVATGTDPLRYGNRRGDPARRAFTLAIVVAAHMAVIALLLARHDVVPVEDVGSTLSVFDVPQAPPSPLASPLPLPVPAAAAFRRNMRPDGSAGRIAATAAPGAVGTAAAVDATAVPDAPPPARRRSGSARRST